jgi:hypothetical protein
MKSISIYFPYEFVRSIFDIQKSFQVIFHAQLVSFEDEREKKLNHFCIQEILKTKKQRKTRIR